MASLETVDSRRRKRIVEHMVDGFGSANEAIVFGNTFEKVVSDSVGTIKFRQEIGTTDAARVAISEDYVGNVVLRTMILEMDQDKAEFAREAMRRVVQAHEKTYKRLLSVLQEVVREKPQPQIIGGRANERTIP